MNLVSRILILLSENTLQMRRAISRGIVVSSGLFIMRIAAFLLSVIVARLAGMETLGEYTLFLTVFMLAAEILREFDTAYLRVACAYGGEDISRKLEMVNIVVKLLFMFAMGGGAILLSGYLDSLFSNSSAGKIVTWAIFCGGLNSVFLILVAIAQKRNLFKIIAILKPTFNLCVLLIVLAGITYGVQLDIEFLIKVYLIVGVTLAIYTISRMVKLRETRSNYMMHTQGYLVSSVILLASASLNLLSNRLDIFFLGYYLDFEQLGVYGVALRMSILVSLMTAVMSIIMMPRAAMASSDSDKFRRYVSLGGFYTAIQLVGGIVLILILEPLIKIIFGEIYTGAVMPATILICQVLVTSAGIPYQALIQCSDKPSRLIYVTMVRMIISVVLLSYLIPSKGVIGAALAIMISTVITTVVIVLVAFKYRPKANIA